STNGQIVESLRHLLLPTVLLSPLALGLAGSNGECSCGRALHHRFQPAAEATAHLARHLEPRQQHAMGTIQRHELPFLFDDFSAQDLPGGSAGVFEVEAAELFRHVREMSHRTTWENRGEAIPRSQWN